MCGGIMMEEMGGLLLFAGVSGVGGGLSCVRNENVISTCAVSD